ncbi:MAG: hypothetical protein WCC77_23120 [Pseudolabrys sp.]|jgi:hypothetical protein
MADDTTTVIRKKSAAPYDNKLNPTRTEYKPVSEKQRQLWQALYEYITQQGGWVVSIPFLKNLRIEVSPGSSLPAKLLEFGYTVRDAGTGTRLSPGNTSEEIFRAVDIVEITLPGK